MKKSLLCVALLSTLIMTGCNKTEEIVSDEQPSGMEYGADSSTTTSTTTTTTTTTNEPGQTTSESTESTTEIKSETTTVEPATEPDKVDVTPAPAEPTAPAEVAPQTQIDGTTTSQEMVDSMKDTVQEMSDGVADTVDTIKEGARETSKDIKESLEDKPATEAAPMTEETDKKLEELKKNEKDDSELNL